MRALLILLLLLVAGCKSAPKKIDVEPFEYKFHKSDDRVEQKEVDRRVVTVRFDGVPFGQAMGILTQECNAPIVWASSLDAQQAVGTFMAMPIASVLEVLARRVGSSVAQVGGVYYVGEIKREDRAFTVVRIPPVVRDEILVAIKASCSTEGAVSVVGSNVWICDTLDSLRKIVAAVETIRERSEKSYVAEVYFIRCSEDHFVRLSADLQFNQVDIFSSSFNVEQLFSMFIDGDAATGWARVSQRPVLYLSEGRSATFTDGKEITRERKSMTETGAIQTTGYQNFSDGLSLTMKLNRVSDKSYAVDFDLSVSVFDKADKADVPATDKSSLKSDGILVQDSQVYYVGSLKRDNRADKGGLFTFNYTKSHDMITIWLRVRELKN